MLLMSYLVLTYDIRIWLTQYENLIKFKLMRVYMIIWYKKLNLKSCYLCYILYQFIPRR
jgi:hypothetical protein